MDIKILLATSPESLAATQEKELANFTFNRLMEIANLIVQGKYTEASQFLFSSPSGDCMGIDSECISFADLGLRPQDHGGDYGDLGDVLSKLEQLKRSKSSK